MREIKGSELARVRPDLDAPLPSIDYREGRSVGEINEAKGGEVTREEGCRIELASDAICVVDEGVFGKMTRFSSFRFPIDSSENEN